MAVQVGQTLDKYELLERVGQGGMAIVYRGRDNSLRREVAVKVLHQHLAEHREARERFEREAHAVAKLRHENILEIYDFSGTDSDESYIVTEFIDGQSLKEFITEQAIHFPEVGAMICAQVCKALQHAHSHGILHRDVKPENVMIRRDGVVKLTDFGIAQMIDLQRLTVTGQLLGSPAYMSPEHVNGGQLDFRTDVFAIGIVLYQLITGELPFKGKNPHEILKRIAEGEFIDPSIVNAHVGKELRRIVFTSMARDKEDRYVDIGAMLAAIEAYLASSGLGSTRDELARYFDAPVSYEMALKKRLVEHLTRTGQTMLDGEQPAALDAFNRVLTLEPDNASVLAILDRVGARNRRWRLVGVAIAAAIIVGLAWGAVSMFSRDRTPLAAALEVPEVPTRSSQNAVVDAGTGDELAASGAVRDAGVSLDASRVAALERTSETRVVDASPRRLRDAAPSEPPQRRDAGLNDGEVRRVTVSVFPASGSEIRINGGSWTKAAAGSAIAVPAGTVTIEGRNRGCCRGGRTVIPASATSGRRFLIRLPFLPATVVATCSRPNVAAKVNGKRASLGEPVTIPIDQNSLTGADVTVTFFALKTSAKSFYQVRPTVKVGPGQTRTIGCSPEV